MKKLISLLLMLSLISCITIVEISGADLLAGKDKWSYTASSEFPGNPIKNAFDNDKSTYWHSKYTAEGSTITGHDNAPFRITVTLPAVTDISGFVYTTRSDMSTGNALSYNIYYSSSDSPDYYMAFSGSFDKACGEKRADFGFNISVKKIVFEITEGVSGYGSMAEFDLIAKDPSKAAKNASEFTHIGEVKNELAKASWQVSASSEVQSNKADKICDGDAKTYWHSNYTAEGSTITSKDNPPFDIKVILPAETVISGFSYTPRQDGNITGTALSYKLYASDDLNTGAKLIKQGNLAKDNMVKVESFGCNVKVKYIIFEITDSAYGFGSCAEMGLFGQSDSNALKNISDIAIGTESKSDIGSSGSAVQIEKESLFVEGKKDWKVTASSEYPDARKISSAFDGNDATYWHTNYTASGSTVTGHDTPPFDVDIVLPAVTTISGFMYTPRQDNDNGILQQYELYVAKSDTDDWYLLDSGTMDKSYTKKTEVFYSNVQAKKVRLRFTGSVGGYGTMAEFDLLKEDKSKPIKSYEEYSQYRDETKLYKIDNSNFTASSPTYWRDFTGMKAVDGMKDSFWHSSTEDTENYPHVLTVDLGAVHTVSAYEYVPRQVDKIGHWLNYSIWGSINGKDYFPVLEKGIFTEDQVNYDTKMINFDKPVEVRYFEFDIDSSFGKHSAAAELNFYQSKADYDKENVNSVETYVLKIDSKDMTVTKGTKTYTKTLDVVPYIDNGSTMIPLRGLLEEMGAAITWDGQKQKIAVNKGEISVSLQIFNDLVYVNNPKKYGEVRYTLLAPPQIKDSRTFIPLRFVSEHLGYNVSWDANAKTITITNKK
ncbi:MAG: discoidin domain-containing protein [Bacillota bacterium]|nr:discoidin domain-containing protein [Bacillota bacterium]